MEMSGQHHAPATLSRGTAFDTYWIGGLVDPSVGLNILPFLGFVPQLFQPIA